MCKILNLREKQIEFGVFYHKFLQQMSDKYGIDCRYRHLVDLCKLADAELRQFCTLYEEMMLSRGISKEQIRKSLSESIAQSVELEPRSSMR